MNDVTEFVFVRCMCMCLAGKFYNIPPSEGYSSSKTHFYVSSSDFQWRTLILRSGFATADFEYSLTKRSLR